MLVVPSAGVFVLQLPAHLNERPMQMRIKSPIFCRAGQRLGSKCQPKRVHFTYVYTWVARQPFPENLAEMHPPE